MGAEPSPSSAELVTGAVVDAVRRPTQVVDLVRGGLNDVLNVGLRAAESAGTLLSAVARTAARPAPDSPLNAEVGTARRWVMVSTDLDDYRTVRKRLARGAYAEDVTINDVVLATIAGGSAHLAARARRGGQRRRPWCGRWCRSASTATTRRACTPTR